MGVGKPLDLVGAAARDRPVRLRAADAVGARRRTAWRGPINMRNARRRTIPAIDEDCSCPAPQPVRAPTFATCTPMKCSAPCCSSTPQCPAYRDLMARMRSAVEAGARNDFEPSGGGCPRRHRPLDPAALKQRIDAEAKALGSTLLASARQIPVRNQARYQTVAGGGMAPWTGWNSGWTAAEPRPCGRAKSVVAVGLNYGPDSDPLDRLRDPGRANFSVYAENRDYDILKKAQAARPLDRRSRAGAQGLRRPPPPSRKRRCTPDRRRAGRASTAIPSVTRSSARGCFSG